MNSTDKKQFYITAISLLIPLVLQNLINTGVTAADVVMLGKIGEEALSGASLGNQVYFILNLFLFGLTSGVSVLAAQYWGKGNVKTIKIILGIAIKISVVISLFFMVGTFFFAENIMHIYSSDSGVISQGVTYLKTVCFSYPIAAVSMVYLYTMRSVEKPGIATLTYFISLIVNVAVNGILIFGLFGFPKMSARGAAAGTLVARFVELACVIIYNARFNKIFVLNIKDLAAKNKLLFRDFIVISGPVVINEFMWGMGSSMTSAILGQLGANVSSANSVVLVVRQLSQVMSFGIAGVSAIMVGKRIGFGQEEQAVEESKRFVWLSLIFGMFGCVMILLLRPFILDFVSITSHAKQILSQMLMILAFVVILQALAGTLIVGIFRGGGETKFGMYVDVTTLWLGSVLLGWLGAFVWKLPVIAVFSLLLIDEVLKIPFITMHYLSGKWHKNITRDI